MSPESPLVAEVGRELVVPQDVTACREEDMVVFTQVEDAADVVTGPVTSIVRILAKVEDFHSQGEGLGNFPLPQPAKLPKVIVARAWIDPVTASAVSCPWATAFLNPEREEQRYISNGMNCLIC